MFLGGLPNLDSGAVVCALLGMAASSSGGCSRYFSSAVAYAESRIAEVSWVV